VLPGLEEELRPAHLRHALVHQKQRDLGAALEELLDGVERLGAGRRLDHPAVGAEVVPEIALDRIQHLGVVVDCQQDRLGHWNR
jgi:hypothetical protein